ncbi:MAG: hypothetical protein CVV05_17310 [Gammaproteobacteria bacterium HGW-Gammaproteobacteria-1]|nr:MAG: hypothetical protein CVV05_17310 [Gammaproteobacteria bacterium HGW-Gammaproteobacteria-1]
MISLTSAGLLGAPSPTAMDSVGELDRCGMNDTAILLDVCEPVLIVGRTGSISILFGRGVEPRKHTAVF